VKQAKGNRELDLLVMENLLYARNVTRLYDLKGSERSRYNYDLTGNNKVLLDENLLEMMPTSPIFVSSNAKRLLSRAVWNDTGFLAVSNDRQHSLSCILHDDMLSRRPEHDVVRSIIGFCTVGFFSMQVSLSNLS